MEQIDEAALLTRLRVGDEDAYALLVRTYGGRMLAVARGLLRHDEDARDAVQTAYVSAFNGLRTFKGECQLATWLHRIVVNTALMKLRTRRRKPEESIEPMLPTYLEDGHHTQNFAEWALQADRLLEQREARALVRSAIGQLPESHRTVLMLRDIEELSTEEVAVTLGITANAVKIRLHRARQALGMVLRSAMAGNVLGASGIQAGDSPAHTGEGGTRCRTRQTPRAIPSHSVSPSRPA
jgi:RNA polymerase sigma-70 factor (ECF subfamily)